MLPITFLPEVLFFALLVTSSAFTTPSRTPSRAPSQTPSRTRSNNRSDTLSLSLAEFSELPSLLLAKYDAKALCLGALKEVKQGAKILTPDVQAQVLSDGSHALMDFPCMFNKPSKLQMRYAQVIGRIMIIGIGLLPNHAFHPEEMAFQLFLLGVSMKPVIRSIKLYRCITSDKCLEECELELHDLESSLP
jgi:hypothetical protein